VTPDVWDQLAERARWRRVRTWPPARLSPSVEEHYQRHVTERAAFLGVAERDLVEHLERRQAVEP
jgi:hypothetical protein